MGVSGVLLYSPLSVLWVCVLCSLHPRVLDPGSETCNLNCRRSGQNNSIWTLPMWGQGVVFPVLDHTWSPGTNLWICSPRGSSTLSCTNLVIWFITLPNCSICCEIYCITPEYTLTIFIHRHDRMSSRMWKNVVRSLNNKTNILSV